MGPQAKQRLIADYEAMAQAKERALLGSGSGSVSGSPARIHDNVSRDSGIGCLKVGGSG